MIALLRQALVSASLLLLTGVAAGGELRDLFYQDFRDSRFEDLRLESIGSDPARQVVPEAAGLRITLPAGTQPWPQTGIMPRFQISGDFVITLSYELLSLEPPKEGYGSGIKIAALAGEREGLATVKRVQRVKEGSVYGVNRATVKEDGQLEHHERYFPTTARSGKLRLRRTGETIHFLVAEDPKEDDFVELSQADFGRADIVKVWVVADPGGGRSATDVLFKDLRFQTEEPSVAGRAWGWGLLVCLGASGLVSLAVLAGCMVLWKSRRPPSSPLDKVEHGR